MNEVSFRERNVHCVVVSFPGTKVHGNETSIIHFMHGVLRFAYTFFASERGTAFRRRHRRHGCQAGVRWLWVMKTAAVPMNTLSGHLLALYMMLCDVMLPQTMTATLTVHRCCQSRGRLYGDRLGGRNVPGMHGVRWIGWAELIWQIC